MASDTPEPVASGLSHQKTLAPVEITEDTSSSSTGLPEGMLFDIVLECSPSDGSHRALEALEIVVLGVPDLGEGEAPTLKRSSPTVWKYSGVIELYSDMDNITVIVRSENAGDFGYLDLSNEETAKYLGRNIRADLEEGAYKYVIETDMDDISLCLKFEAAASVNHEHPDLTLPVEGRLGSMPSRADEQIEHLDDALSASEYHKNSQECSRRFDRTADVADISKAIEYQQIAVLLTPEDHPNMRVHVANLGGLFRARFVRAGNLSDITDAIKCQQKALGLAPLGHADRPAYLNELGISFVLRFDQASAIDDISSGIEHISNAVLLTPKGHPDLPSRIDGLGTSFSSRFRQKGDFVDISAAIKNHSKAVQLTLDGDTAMPFYLNNLGSSYLCRFQRTQDLLDISNAVKYAKQAVLLTHEENPRLVMYLDTLGTSLSDLFGETGIYEDILDAIKYLERVIKITPEGHADMPSYKSKLGDAFLHRFGHTADLVDLNNTIECHQRAVFLTPEGHTHKHLYLAKLGSAFLKRSQRSGSATDISNGIECLRTAISLIPSGHPTKPHYLTNLGCAFSDRFEKTKDLADISRAIKYKQEAVRITPDNQGGKSLGLSLLGNSLLRRFVQTRDSDDLFQAMKCQEKAVFLNPKESVYLSRLGSSFYCRFEHFADVDDITQAIEYHRKSVSFILDDHPMIHEYLINLGHTLFRRFEHTRNHDDCLSAIHNFRLAATQISGSPAKRLLAAKRWAHSSMEAKRLSMDILDQDEALRAYSVAIELLGVVAGINETIQTRHTNLVDISALTVEAVALALVLGHNNTALEWLEQGRCLVWNQLNQLRSPVDILRTHNATLANRFLALSKELESSGSRSESTAFSSVTALSHQMEIEAQVRKHVELAQEWTRLLDRIRTIPTFHNFLRPPDANSILSQLPQDGPVIFINVLHVRCDAMILLHGADEALHVPLDNFSYQKAVRLCTKLRNHLEFHGLRVRDERGIQRRPRNSAEMKPLRQILRELWIGVVRPILDAMGYSTPQKVRNHIRWCATGPLAFLPLHAAGIYGEESKTQSTCLSDFAVSSYTPTVSILLDKLKKSTTSIDPQEAKILLISQPNTPGLSPIPATTTETQAVFDIMQQNHIQANLLEGSEATKARVSEKIGSYNCVHLACHASQDPIQPLQSGFSLHDGKFELLEIIRQQLPVAELAFLSACQTSVGDEKLSEEAVHLAAGMLAAGYQGVVATMWSIRDATAPEIAKDFYNYLLMNGHGNGTSKLNARDAAYALDYAVQRIRETLKGDDEAALLTWVPYIHFGL
ncbi:CHAT domain-containing protein [Crepidotus variabilis]|uniref:CHAT domain-containing protein n=1 Tax=Crepidotus variabilis TaxID=179855 RepID=A0A9P6E5R2_9AGAR|nr:CHAT domain-containing protein [Crepidotus variabilis]